MDFPGGVRVVYSQNLKGGIIVGIDGALKAPSRRLGIHFTNDRAIYGTEMPNVVREFITNALNERYAPVGKAALGAKEEGDAINWRRLRNESRDILQSIGKEARQMWRDME